MIIAEASQQNSNTSVLEVGLTPSSNTGLNSQTVSLGYTNDDEGNATNCISLGVRVDWLQGTIRFEDEQRFIQVINHLLSLCDDRIIWERDKGTFKGIQWAHRGYSVKGLKVWWNNPSADIALGHALISLPGGLLSTLECRQIWEIAKFLVDVCDFKCTRLDVALDDFEKRISFDQVRDACEARQYARFGNFLPIRGGNKKRENLGFTVYLGSRQSDKIVRFYDKHAESKGKIKSYRWEGEYREDRAVKVLNQWLLISDESFERESPKFLAGTVLGTIEFCDRKKEKNVSRMVRLDWWKAFIEVVGCSITHSLKKAATPFDASIRWVMKQVAPTLAMIRKVFGLMSYRGWIEEEMLKAEQRFSDEQIAKIAYASGGLSDVTLEQGISLSDVLEEENSEGDAERWVWAWYTSKNGNNAYWSRCRYFGRNEHGHCVRFSGEPKSKALPRGWVHFGLSQPKFAPGSAGLRKAIVLESES